MGLALTIDVEGMEGAALVAQRVRNLGEDFRPLLEILGAVLEASTSERFEGERGPYGVPWPKSQRAIRQGGRTLFDRGDLFDSIRHEVRPAEVEVGFDDMNKPPGVVAALHYGSHRQTVVVAHSRTINEAFGVPLPSPVVQNVRPHGRMTNLPARPMIGVDGDDRHEAEARWLDHLRSLFSGGP